MLVGFPATEYWETARCSQSYVQIQVEFPTTIVEGTIDLQLLMAPKLVEYPDVRSDRPLHSLISQHVTGTSQEHLTYQGPARCTVKRLEHCIYLAIVHQHEAL